MLLLPVDTSMTPMTDELGKILAKSLLSWYRENKRELPWRRDRNPYQIWLSEVMLQQTTVVAVIPYYERFLGIFPTVEALAKAPLESVLEQWSGLGYYSRARNLHKAAQALHENGFPKTAAELLELPGFGPYTSRAVSSIAFDESVGVLDGNVIRVLTRVMAWDFAWWNNESKNILQKSSDLLAGMGPSHEINQGLMELGATVCTPHNPNCLLCPWQKNCLAFKKGKVLEIPKKKPRKKSEVWVWDVSIYSKNQKIALIKNDYAPFLKNQALFPGKIKRQSEKPKIFDLKHGITHHDIYIRIKKESGNPPKSKDLQWAPIKDVKKINPSNLLQKVLQKIADKD